MGDKIPTSVQEKYCHEMKTFTFFRYAGRVLASRLTTIIFDDIGRLGLKAFS